MRGRAISVSVGAGVDFLSFFLASGFDARSVVDFSRFLSLSPCGYLLFFCGFDSGLEAGLFTSAGLLSLSLKVGSDGFLG